MDRGQPRLLLLLLATLTALAAWIVATRVRLSPDLAPLLPAHGPGAALATFVRAFHGGDPGLVLLEGDDPAEVHRAALRLSAALAPLPASTRLALEAQSLTPGRLLLLADAPLRRELAALLEPSAMRARLAETRALLLAPGSAALAPTLARDPLRLGQAVAERRTPGGRARSDGELASADGRARLVIVEPPGSALHGEEARRFVLQVEDALRTLRSEHPAVRARLTGGPSLAVATEDLLRSDLTRSSLLALLLASAVFVALQRRPRALLSVLPPLLAGSLLAAAVGALFPGGVAGVAVAFVSVVLGVGMDSGVHVHAAVREAVARGSASPAAEALSRVARPVLGAALVAGCSFACLALSRVEALRQLGLLAAAGEVATALWICAFSPLASGWLERRSVGLPDPPRWAFFLARISRHRLARPLSLATGGALVAVLLWTGGPDRSGGLLLIRPEGLAPQQVYRDLAALLGQPDRPPWVVLVRDADEDAARARADRLFEALLSRPQLTGAMTALTPWAPARATLARRREEMQALDLPGRAADLEAALRELQFQPGRFREALEELAHPTDPPTPEQLRRRFVGRDGEAVVVQIEAQAPDPEALAALVRSVDPAAEVTGWGALEPTLRRALAEDLPRVGGWAALLLVASLALAVRRPRDVALAAAVVAAELVAVLVGMRLLGIPLHLYDALVLPVLLGVTADEVLFVLWAARRGEAVEEALAREAPLVASTALTTAAGFLALLGCAFPPLRHLGAVAALGSVAGVALALLVVPAWARPGETAGELPPQELDDAPHHPRIPQDPRVPEPPGLLEAPPGPRRRQGSPPVRRDLLVLGVVEHQQRRLELPHQLRGVELLQARGEAGLDAPLKHVLHRLPQPHPRREPLDEIPHVDGRSHQGEAAERQPRLPQPSLQRGLVRVERPVRREDRRRSPHRVGDHPVERRPQRPHRVHRRLDGRGKIRKRRPVTGAIPVPRSVQHHHPEARLHQRSHEPPELRPSPVPPVDQQHQRPFPPPPRRQPPVRRRHAERSPCRQDPSLLLRSLPPVRPEHQRLPQPRRHRRRHRLHLRRRSQRRERQVHETNVRAIYRDHGILRGVGGTEVQGRAFWSNRSKAAWTRAVASPSRKRRESWW